MDSISIVSLLAREWKRIRGRWHVRASLEPRPTCAAPERVWVWVRDYVGARFVWLKMAAARTSRMVFARAARVRHNRLWHCSTLEASEGIPLCLPTASLCGSTNAGTSRSLSKRHFHSSSERAHVLRNDPWLCELLLCCHYM